MKTKILLFISLVLLAVQGWAAPVDEASARAIVQDFVISMKGKNFKSMPSSGGSSLQLVHAEKSNVKLTQNSYYIYNTGESFVITAGDDRAVSILGYGDGDFDMNNIPCGLKAMLNIYKEQIDYLLEHPGLKVEKPSMNAPMLRGTSVEPLLKSEWDQMAPYGNKCPLYNNSRCVTGCACTSLCQVMYYWKYPTTPTPTIPSYTTETHQISVPELPSITFDWANMKDCYYLNYSPNYTTVQADAVAWLMRYVGQAEEMDYSPYGSGAYDSDILRAAKLFGYNRHADLIYEWDWDEHLWTGIISSELYYYHRPVIYGANDDNSNLGHSFVVDGYKTDNEYNVSYHINWGWGEGCNGYFVFHAFNILGLQFNSYQTMIYNLEPQKPEIEVDPYPSIWFHVVQGETKKVNIKITGYALTGNLTAKIDNANGVFSIDKNQITKNEAMNGTTITVTYNPTEAGHQLAHLTISGGGAPAQTVELSGAADSPIITVNPSSLSFVAYTGETVTKTFNVTTNFSNSDLSLKLNNSNGIYSIDKTSISKSDAINGATVTVTYKPTEAGSSSASITISGGGAQPKNVTLSGNAPEIMVSPTSLDFGQVKLDETKSLTFTVTGTGLTGNLTVSSSNPHFTVSPATIIASKAADGAIVTVTFKPTSRGTINTNITVSGGGAVSKKIDLSGKGINPTITVGLDSWSFSTYPNQIVGKTFSVRGNDLTDDLTLTLNDTTGIYSINKTIITQSEAMSNAIPQVTVTYAPTEVGATTASITISGGGADPKTVSLNGSAIAEILVSPASLNFVSMYNNIHVGDTIKRSFNVHGKGLTGDLTVCLNDDSGNYSIDKTSISKSDAVSGPVVTVTYAPKEAGTSNASVTVSGGGAEPKTVTISGTAVKPEISVNPESLSLITRPGETITRSFIVTGTYLAAGLILSLNDDNGIYSINKRSIGRSDAANGDTVTVTYSPTEVGTSTAYITISGGGYGSLVDADPVTVTLSGTAIEPEFTVSPETLSFNAYTGHSLSKTFSVTGAVLSDLDLTLNDDSGFYSLEKTTITTSEASNGATVTVTYNPTANGSHNASITISGGSAEAKTVALEGCAVTPGIPEITTDVNTVIFESTYTGYQSSRTITITCLNLLNDLQLSLVRDNTSSFGLSKQTITPEEAAAGAKVTVYFSPTSGGAKHATLSIKSDGVETVSIPINGTGIKSDGYITAWPTNLSFDTQVGTPVTQTFKVTYSSANGGGVVMISSVGSGDDMAFDSKGGNEGSMLNLNTANNSSNLTRAIVPFESIDLWRKEFIGPIEPVLIKSLVLELTGDDCFDITPKRIRLSSVPCSAYVTVTYNPECVGEHDGAIKIKLFVGSARPFTLHLHGTATDQFDAPSYDNDGNDLMIMQSGSSINTLVDEMLMNIKVYAEGQNIIIDCPEADNAIISDIAGHAWKVNLQAGQNVIPVNSSGIYIVRIREKTTKLMLK